MDPTQRPTVLITGASSGIGRELAKLFAVNHHDLVLVARSEGALNTLAEELTADNDVNCMVVAADLSDPDSVDVVWQMVEEAGLHIGTLVNCAGFGLFGPFHQTALETELQMIQLNVTALTEFTKRALPGMLASKQGRILNVASTAAFQPGPLMAVYYATKAYVLSFSEAIAEELSGTGVTVTTLCPGPTETGFQSAARLGGSGLVKGKKLPSAMHVALAGFRGLMRGKRIVVPGLANKIGVQAVRLTSRRMATRIVHRMQQERRD